MPSPQAFGRILGHAVAASTVLTGLAAQEPAPAATLELPKYTVTTERELPPPEPWLYARIEGFEVLSNASAGKTRDLLDEFQRFTHAVNLVWPGMVPPSAAPAALLICGRSDKFGAFLPADTRTERARSSLTLRQREQSAIVLDLQAKVLNLSTAEGTAAAVATARVADENNYSSESRSDPGFAVDAYQQLYREYIRFLLAGRDPPAPIWFSEGLAQIFMAIEVTENSITLGKLENPNLSLEPGTPPGVAPREDVGFSASLARQALMPLPEMFAVTGDSDTALNPLRNPWAKQCYAFVHWGLYGDQGAHQKDFYHFLARLEREPPAEPLFKECFKQNYRDMLFTLRSYIETTRYKVAGVKAEKGQKIPVPPPVVVREATQAEVGRIQGEALNLAGHPAEAHQVLLTAYLRGERDPALLAALGLAEANGGDAAKARQFLEAATAAHVARPRAYIEVARLRLAEARTRPEVAGGQLSSRQTAAVLESLFAARSLPPPLPEVYELIAEAWASSAALPNAAQLAVLDEGVRLNPRNSPLVYANAALKAKIGQTAEARSLVKLGLRVAPDPEMRAKFEALQATLPPASPPKS